MAAHQPDRRLRLGRPRQTARKRLGHIRARSIGWARNDETGEPIVVKHHGGEHWARATDMMALFETSAAQLTHHAPHPDCLDPNLLGDWVAGACASDLSHLTDCGTITLWAHGHIHDRRELTRPNGTRITRNPAGHSGTVPGFDPGLVVTV